MKSVESSSKTDNIHPCSIRSIRAEDVAGWGELWKAYCAFYKVVLPADTTRTTWHRILDQASPVNAIVAENTEGRLLGFANYILHPHTWSDRLLCYLEDLFVEPEARGQDIGFRLISELINRGKTQGWGRIYWHTEHDNKRARRLYDRFDEADGFVRYKLLL